MASAPGVTVRLVLNTLVLTVPALLALRGRLAWIRRGATSTPRLCSCKAVEPLSVSMALLKKYPGTLLLVIGWLCPRHGQCPQRLHFDDSSFKRCRARR